jgi:hypothetical protein
MLKLVLFITIINLLVTVPVSCKADSNLRPNNPDNPANVLHIQNYLEEDDKFWEKQLQAILSTDPPFITPTPPIPTPPPNGIPPSPTPVPPSPTPPTPTVTRPPSNVICNGITQFERAIQLTSIAIEASGRIEPGTPQDKALEWLIQTDPYFVCPDDKKALQRYILAVFYYSTDGDNWNECSAPDDVTDPDSIDRANNNCSVITTPIPGGELNPSFLPTTEGSSAWLTPVYECEWSGITCRVETTCVDRIEFEDNGVGGTLPYEIRDLPDLRFFILERGTTQGTIPTEFAEIEDLLFLDLDFNELTGTIPEEIYTLTDLFQLDLNDNMLTGTLSPSIGDLSNLVFLQIAANELNGPIPNELGQLTSLLTGSFEMNDLTGSIPVELCDALNEKPAYILITDCSPEGGAPPKVRCDCCTDCFPEG